MMRVMYRPSPSALWESCYLVPGDREKAINSARQVADQERCIGGRGQAGVCDEDGKLVTVVRPTPKTETPKDTFVDGEELA